MRLSATLAAVAALTVPVAAQPAPGSCVLGSAEAVLDANDVRARVFNTGGLFYRNSVGAQYLVGGASPIYAASLWVGGEVDGAARTAGATFSDFEFWPGPLGADGRPVDPADCSAYDRIYSVSAEDIAAYETSGQATADLAEWPVALGAPILDGDGVAGNYDLAAGDRPDLGGGAQAAFWVMNDVGNQHDFTGSDPLGIEVRVLAVAPRTGDDRIDTATLYRYEIVNKSGEALDPLRVGMFVDPDLGDAGDDFVGSDPARQLGFVYNATDEDSDYGSAPPAVGISWLSGTLGGAFPWKFLQDCEIPGDREEIYHYLQARWGDGDPIREGGFGCYGDGPETTWMFPGDPLAEAFWSEISEGNVPSDRYLSLVAEPVVLAPGASATFALAVLYGRGDDHLDSISELREATDAVRAAYEAGQIVPVSADAEPDPSEASSLALSAPHPNPASGAVRFEVHTAGPDSATLTVLDVLGRRMSAARVAAGQELELDVSRWAPGVYVAVLEADGRVAARRFTVAR